MKKTLLSSIILLTLSGCNETSVYWTNFIDSRDEKTGLYDLSSNLDKKDVIADYSFAGYKFGESNIDDIDTSLEYIQANPELFKIYNVTDFGAVANDNISDKTSIKNTISTIKSDRDNGETRTAILLFSEGKFIINSEADLAAIDENSEDYLEQVKNEQPIFIDIDNIVIKGSGKGVTTLFNQVHLLPENPSKKWTTPHLLQVGAKSSSLEETVTSKIIDNNTRYSSFSITVEDGDQFNVGDSVQIESLVERAEAIEDAIAPYLLEYKKESHLQTAVWANLTKGLKKIEKHLIKSIDGNTITFHTPIAHDIDAEKDNWVLKTVNSLSNIGIEDLTIQGNWHQEFVHHEDYIHDSGYSMLSMKNLHNSWLRNIEIKDFSQGGVLYNTFNVTAKNIETTGNAGHLAFTIMYGNYNLIDGITDTAGSWHSPGVSKYSIGNVYLNSTYTATSSIDLHGEQSIDTLFDNMKGDGFTDAGAHHLQINPIIFKD
ncbi:DUF4955 domain-containing protein [Vibrio sp. SS-MA-C1-2]|nr:DUF4955 domain-containing protein [Vibrio sp. SS-MA-C1-2]UJF17701.1 DUF4955 domain-containing protein [Vibrio sp. SS-MA-C1-2]